MAKLTVYLITPYWAIDKGGGRECWTDRIDYCFVRNAWLRSFRSDS